MTTWISVTVSSPIWAICDEDRYTYGEHVRYGANVRYGGEVDTTWTKLTATSASWSAVSDPTTSWTKSSATSATWTKV